MHYMLTFLSVVRVEKTSKMWIKEKQEVSTLAGFNKLVKMQHALLLFLIFFCLRGENK
jgi:hypothetical protein